MYVEFHNRNTNVYYYLQGSIDDPVGLVWTPDVKEHLLNIDINLTVGQLFDLVRPVVDRLRADNTDVWEVHVWDYQQDANTRCLTQSPIVSLGRYAVGDVVIVNGVRQPTMFHAQY